MLCDILSEKVFVDVGRTIWTTAAISSTTTLANLTGTAWPVGALMQCRISDLFPGRSAKLGGSR